MLLGPGPTGRSPAGGSRSPGSAPSPAAASASTPCGRACSHPIVERRAPGAATSTRRRGSGPRRSAGSTGSPSSAWPRPSWPWPTPATSTADPDRSGVIFATGVGGFDTLAEQVLRLQRAGRPAGSRPFLVPMMMANAGAANISMRFGWHGPSRPSCTACAAGTHAVAAAARLVAIGPLRRGHRRGRRGGLPPGGGGRLRQHDRAVHFGHLAALRRPPGRLRHRRGRGRPGPRGAGTGPWPAAPTSTPSWPGRPARPTPTTSPPPRPTAPAPWPAWSWPWTTPGSPPRDVAHINAHGTSTPLNDLAEARAIAKVFGEPGPLVTSTKGVTGHGLGAAGAIEAVASALTIDHGSSRPTAGFEELDPEIHLDVVHGEPRPWEPRAGAVELLRLRRPQRLPGPVAAGVVRPAWERRTESRRSSP